MFSGELSRILSFEIEELVRLCKIYHQYPDKQAVQTQIIFIQHKIEKNVHKSEREMSEHIDDLKKCVKSFVDKPLSKECFIALREQCQKFHNNLKEL
jgi:hypothetical protein